jgi:cyclopropane-fatty-acyl-phospholipid synthase
MIQSKLLKKYNNISHGFFNNLDGYSKGVYKSLNCGIGKKEKKKNIEANLKKVCKKLVCSKNIRRNNGEILIIDYGYNSNRMFNTLQSVKNHRKNNFLENIYQSDITHMINFNYYKKKIKDMKLDFIKLTTQREFLIKLGILERAEIISNKAPFSKKTDIYFRLRRLIDKQEMGSLFKVLFASKKKNNFKLGF